MTVPLGAAGPRAPAWRAWLGDLFWPAPVRVDRVDAVRAGLCAGLVVVAGWAVGDLSAGLVASVGAFTALYGAGRPYRSRAVELALIALAFAAVVTLALTIGSGGHPADLTAFLVARGVDTAVGCGIGLAVFVLVAPGAAFPAPAALVAATLRDAARVVGHLVDRSTATPAARAARGDLNQRVQALSDVHEAGDPGPPGTAAQATAWWPALDAAQALAHHVLAACWSFDRSSATAPSLPAARGAAISAELEELARQAAPVAGRGPLPGPPRTGDGFLAPELDVVRRSLPAAGPGGAPVRGRR